MRGWDAADVAMLILVSAFPLLIIVLALNVIFAEPTGATRCDLIETPQYLYAVRGDGRVYALEPGRDLDATLERLGCLTIRTRATEVPR